MSKTFNNYKYRYNQLSADNPFRFIGTTNNPYLPKVPNQGKSDNSSIKAETIKKPYQNEPSLSINDKRKRNSSPTYIKKNSFNIITSKSYEKNSKKNYSQYYQNKDHVAELFNYSDKGNTDYYAGSTSKQNALQLEYSIYTTPNNTKKKSKNNNENLYDIKAEKISKNELSEYFEENCILMENYAYKENQNIRFRDYMEDKGLSIININGDPNKSLFCLFDGHGGEEVSRFLQNNFLKYFKEMIAFDNSNINENLIKLFKFLDEKIKDLNCYQVGSTACIIYIIRENGRKCLYSANIGDTRSILIYKNGYKRLSYDHRASDENEYKRIINEGGIVFEGRVYGSLMLSRAFGDWELKSYGVSCEPFIKKINISENDKYVIIATDGVWDILEDEDIFNLSKKSYNSKELCNIIINKSIEKGSMDNISCFVIKL